MEEGGGGSLQDGKSNLQQAYQITQKKMKVPKLKQTASHALAERSFFFQRNKHKEFTFTETICACTDTLKNQE